MTTNALLTAEMLHKLYIEDGMSQEDIGRLAGVSRTTVSNRMKKSGIPARSLRDARIKALERGKLDSSRHQFDSQLFYTYTPRSAYAMGILWAAHSTTPNGFFVTCGQSSLPVAMKFLTVVRSNKRLELYYNNNYPAWRTYFHGPTLVEHLAQLGLDDSRMPSGIPAEESRHFIRGYWERRGFSADQESILKEMSACLPEHESSIVRNGWAFLSILSGAEAVRDWLYEGVDRSLTAYGKRDQFLESKRMEG